MGIKYLSGHSANFEARWSWIARVAVNNIFDPRVSASVCHQIADWGKDAENRKKFGKFLDLIAEKKEIKKERAQELEKYLIENCHDLVKQAKEMIDQKCMIADYTFLADEGEKRIFDKMITNFNGINWDSVAVIQMKSSEFMSNVVKRDQQLFRKATSMAEQIIKTTGWKILSPGQVSRDFISHMATGFEWRNGIIVAKESFDENMLSFITELLPKKDAQNAVVSYCYYIIKLKEKGSLLIRRITNEPARAMVWLNMLTHSGFIQYRTIRGFEKYNQPLITYDRLKQYPHMGASDCDIMLEPGKQCGV